MTRLAVFAILSLAARNAVALGVAAPAEGHFGRGRELLAAGRYPEAAEAFHEALRLQGLSSFTIRIAVYCDVSNLDRQLRSSGHPPDLILLRRPVRDQYCWGLYWGLFPTRAQAQANVGRVPAAVRGVGQSPAPISAGVLVPMEPPPPVRSTPRMAQALEPPPATTTLSADPPPLVPSSAAVATDPAPSRGLAPPPVSPPVTEPATGAWQDPPALASPVGSRRFPRAELSASYAFLWVDERLSVPELDFELGGTIKTGWILSANVNVTDKIGVTAELSGHKRTYDFLGVEELSPSLLALHAGVRYTDREDRVATPYAQALWGFTRLSLLGESDTNFSFQPGIGVMLRLSECFKFGAGADYRRVFRNGSDGNQFRLHAGVVFCVCDK